MDVYNLVNPGLKEMVFLPGERNEKINKLSIQERNLQKFKWGKWNLTVEKLQLWRTRLIQEWNRVRFRAGVGVRRSNTCPLSGWAGPETQPARSRGLVSGPKASLMRCLLHMWVHGSIKLLRSKAPSHGWISTTSSVVCYPASLRSGCQKPQSLS